MSADKKAPAPGSAKGFSKSTQPNDTAKPTEAEAHAYRLEQARALIREYLAKRKGGIK